MLPVGIVVNPKPTRDRVEGANVGDVVFGKVLANHKVGGAIASLSYDSVHDAGPIHKNESEKRENFTCKRKKT